MTTTAVLVTYPAASPVDAAVEVVHPLENGHAETRFTVRENETVLSGHYPGFPIFPGVCLVESAHLSALATAPARGAVTVLTAIESTRFTGPVYPGDELSVELDWKFRVESVWHCTVKIRSVRGNAASVKLRYLITTHGDLA